MIELTNTPLTHGVHHLGLTVADRTAAKDLFLNGLLLYSSLQTHSLTTQQWSEWRTRSRLCTTVATQFYLPYLQNLLDVR